MSKDIPHYSVPRPYRLMVRSFTTSPARIRPATDGTNAILPGISLLWVHFLAVDVYKRQVKRKT